MVIWEIFRSKLRGHFQYYGGFHNSDEIKKFLHEAKEIAFKCLSRHSQKKSFIWEKFNLFLKVNPLPKVQIVDRLF